MKYLLLSIMLLLADSLFAALICYLSSDYVFYAALAGWILVTIASIIAGIFSLALIKNWRLALILFANIIISFFIFLIGNSITLNSGCSIDDPKVAPTERLLECSACGVICGHIL